MWKGTTPTHTFTIPDTITLTGAQAIQITYAQRNEVVLQFQADDITVSGQALSVTLTQAQTMAFDRAYNIEIQVRLVLADGSALASNIISEDVSRCLDDNVLPLE